MVLFRALPHPAPLLIGRFGKCGHSLDADDFGNVGFRNGLLVLRLLVDALVAGEKPTLDDGIGRLGAQSVELHKCRIVLLSLNEDAHRLQREAAVSLLLLALGNLLDRNGERGLRLLHRAQFFILRGSGVACLLDVGSGSDDGVVDDVELEITRHCNVLSALLALWRRSPPYFFIFVGEVYLFISPSLSVLIIEQTVSHISVSINDVFHFFFDYF